jgi:DNA-binding NtrC family response regulator
LLQAAVMTDNETIDRRDVTAAIGEMDEDRSINLLEQPIGNGFDLEEHLNSVRGHYLRRAMEEAAGSKTKASRLLGMKHYQTLDAQLERLGVDWQRTKKGK